MRLSSAQAPDQYAQSPQSIDAQNEIHESAPRILESRGYVLTGADRADLVVRIEEGRRERRVIVPALVPAPTNSDRLTARASEAPCSLSCEPSPAPSHNASSALRPWHGACVGSRHERTQTERRRSKGP